MNDHVDQFKPNTTVAVIVAYKDKFLLVEEFENNQVVYNQPAGHIEADENLINAAKRELEEETGLVLSPEYLSGIYYFHRPDLSLYYLRFCFVVHVKEELATTPQDDDITACHWFTLDEIEAKSAQLRSPMVLDCIKDYLSGQRVELPILKSNL